MSPPFLPKKILIYDAHVKVRKRTLGKLLQLLFLIKIKQYINLRSVRLYVHLGSCPFVNKAKINVQGINRIRKCIIVKKLFVHVLQFFIEGFYFFETKTEK